MENRYRWDDADMETLRGYLDAARLAIEEASLLVQGLATDMSADTTWTGEHKVAFMAWMDLVRQFHEEMASPDIAVAATSALDSFMNALSGYYANSAPYASLGDVS